MTSSTLGMNTTVSCDLVPHYQEACFAARVLSVRHALHFLLCLMLKDITIFWLIHLLYDIKLVNEDFCYMENGHIRVWVLHYLHLVHKFMWNRLSQYLILRSLMDSRCVKFVLYFVVTSVLFEVDDIFLFHFTINDWRYLTILRPWKGPTHCSPLQLPQASVLSTPAYFPVSSNQECWY